MAALTTALGMIPLLFDAFFVAMAVTIISGLIVATLLTMVVVPVLYAICFRVTERMHVAGRRVLVKFHRIGDRARTHPARTECRKIRGGGPDEGVPGGDDAGRSARAPEGGQPSLRRECHQT